LFLGGIDGNFSLTMDYSSTYTVENGGKPRLSGVSAETEFLKYNTSTYDLKYALEALENVDTVDVTKEAMTNGSSINYITFTSDLGELPLLQMNMNGSIPPPNVRKY
jgi:hypothetical protein